MGRSTSKATQLHKNARPRPTIQLHFAQPPSRIAHALSHRQRLKRSVQAHVKRGDWMQKTSTNSKAAAIVCRIRSKTHGTCCQQRRAHVQKFSSSLHNLCSKTASSTSMPLPQAPKGWQAAPAARLLECGIGQPVKTRHVRLCLTTRFGFRKTPAKDSCHSSMA